MQISIEGELPPDDEEPKVEFSLKRLHGSAVVLARIHGQTWRAPILTFLPSGRTSRFKGLAESFGFDLDEKGRIKDEADD